ncbi:MAG TPA: heavy metal sensor histidine kinase [Zoogloea sp.]|uniref:heavy metal sensor histidine kinase n=1 Tax=Zoogloea sp. TaxID=49181 RepID=UPI002C2358EA|nr:heavy metal sensor histidine kinase [Zoogloea sp.]HMY50821.1 heavy metal sensor histidine kinase [Rhodocyclaceae bacterium]HMZ75393.1 heavy metal sensor histidine kinase [Rhodocyclaceae bacterium]HNB64431.1 heavy metal sensor histidine kinase [Rhodocyclaceae bacterium]HNC78113.1 heavy metal sensor histidine kinase [Rhodocyclaceae bacterium]HND24587.1 heavy metal sensor histidine kinase [Rhodocyclaceae bacterium]
MGLNRRLSLTVRLTLLFALASSAVLLILGFIVGASVERHFEELDRATLYGQLADLRRGLALGHLHGEAGGEGGLVEGAHLHPPMMELRGPDGRVLAASPGAVFPSDVVIGAPGPQVWQDASGHWFRGLAAELPAAPAGAGPLRARVATDISHHQAFMDGFRRTLWGVVVASALATGLLGWAAARSGLAPLEAMRRTAAQVSAQRLDPRLAVDSVPVELAALAESLNAMLARLEESFRRLSDFSSDLAHELRTPVSNLMTQTQVALSRPRSAAEYREVLESGAEELERLTRTIADMLFLAKADNGLIVPAREPVELADEVRALFEFYAALAEEVGVSLSQAGAGRVAGDRLMLRRALGNLLSNALRHTPAGGAVRVTLGNAEDRVVVAVANDGEPIPAEHLPRLFDRFYRADPARRHGSDGDGAGLGLAITRSIVRAHGGEVVVRSGVHGTVFQMRLPPAGGS